MYGLIFFSTQKFAAAPLADAAPETPPEVCDLVMRLMAHRKEDRPADARAAAAELAALERRFTGDR